MRRLVAVFSSKHDKSDSHQQSNRSHPSPNQRSKKHLKLPVNNGFTSSPSVRTPSVTSTPQLSSVSDHGQSSGSSSGSASLSLPTPEEGPPTSLTRSATRRSWKDWLGGKRSEPVPPAVPELPKSSVWDQSMPVWNERLPTLQGPQTSVRVPKGMGETDDETSSESDDEESVPASDHPRSVKPVFVASPAMARQNLESLIKNTLAPPSPASPFVQHSITYLFPRSCNRPQALPPVSDTRRIMFKRRLLIQLENLSVDDEKAILPFSSRRAPVPIKTSTLPDYETSRPPDTTKIFAASPGVRRWISRPCFEDRFSVFLPLKDGIQQSPVVSTLAVATLEYSEFLDVMVDPDFDPSSPPLDTPQDISWTPASDDFLLNNSPPSIVNNDTLVRAPPVNSRLSHIPLPSPLRNQHNREVSLPKSASKPILLAPATGVALEVVSPSESSSYPQNSQILPQPSPPLAQHPVVAPVKRAVRFVEDDAEDVIPLHLLRQKQKREEKARFLRAEQRRRLMEQELERRRLEAEAMEKERGRIAKERERREIEQRRYAEELAAARLRRESQRAGIIPGLKTDSSGNLLLPSPSTTSLRETERNTPRELKRNSLMPHHTGSSSSIPRREASDSALSPSYPYSLETSSYLTGSGGHSPGNSNSGHGHHSRPGSMYSSSSEDGRASNKRHSMVSNNFTRSFTDRTTSYPMWSGGNPSLTNIPPVPNIPSLPELMNDFVLLPPSAPFMMHQYPRQSRNSSPGPSNSSGSLRGTSANSSSERVNMYRQSSRPKETYSAPPSPSTSPSRPTHVRHGSGDSRRSSMPIPAPFQGPAPRSQSDSSTRGRSKTPHSQTMQGMQYLQPPNPWTALPTQHGTLPKAMPVSSHSHSMGLSTSSNGSFPGGSTKGRGGTKRQTIV